MLRFIPSAAYSEILGLFRTRMMGNVGIIPNVHPCKSWYESQRCTLGNTDIFGICTLCISERSPWKNVEQKPLSEFLETGRGERKIAFSSCFALECAKISLLRPCFAVRIGSRSGQNWLLLCVIYSDISDTLKRAIGRFGSP